MRPARSAKGDRSQSLTTCYLLVVNVNGYRPPDAAEVITDTRGIELIEGDLNMLTHMTTRTYHRSQSPVRGLITHRLLATCLAMTALVAGLWSGKAMAGAVTATGAISVRAGSAIDGIFDGTTVNPVITETVGAGEWPSNSEIHIVAPAGFVFNAAQPVTGEVIVGDIDIGGGASMPFDVTPGATSIVFTVNNASTVASSIRFLNIQLRATTCAAGVLGDAADVLVSILNPVGAPANAVLVDVMVDNSSADLDHFTLTAFPLTQLPASNILFTLTARDACANPIEFFRAQDYNAAHALPLNTPINLLAAGGAATRTFSNGSIAVTAGGANMATIDAAVMFDPNGQGTFNATSPTGEDALINVSATLAVASGSVNVRWINATCALAPVDALRPLGALHAITATVTPNAGSPLAGIDVNFNISAGPNAGTMGLSTTNGAGQATFFYFGNGGAGVDTIDANGAVGAVTFMCSTTAEWVDPSCAITAMLAGAVNSMETGNVTVERRAGFPAPDGTTVNFEVISGPNAGTVGNDTTTAGAASFMYMSNGQPGVDTIHANGTIAGASFSCFQTKEWIDPVCMLDPLMAINQVSTPHTVTITLLRRPGVPAAGNNVTFDVTAGPNAVAIVPQVLVTNAMGQVDFTYNGGATPGVDTITASGTVDGVPFMCTASKEFIDSGCMLQPITDTNQVGTIHSVTATVLRNNPPNTPAAGTTVQFLITAGPNAGEAFAGVTNINGQVTFTYASNGTPGTDTINATTTVDGVNIACNATKDWINAACSLDPPADSNLTGTDHTTTVTVTRNGAPEAGAIVNFLVTTGPNAGAVDFAVSNGAGQATFTYTSNGTPGTDTITASGNISGVPFECTATKTWLNPQCSLAPPAEDNIAGTQHTVTVTVTRDGAAASGVAVAFNITAGPNTGLVFNAVTNGAGQAAFTYTGAAGAGTDTIEASGMIDGIPFSCTASKTWQASDGSGVDPDVQDGAPNDGDGNNDGIPDKLQPHVVSLLDIFGNYVTIVSPAGTMLKNVMALATPGDGIPPPDVVFPIGWLKFEVHGVTPGASIIVDIIMHSNPTVNTYYKFGPTPIIPVDLFYRFLFDGTTGSEVLGNVVRLTLVDGQRGDNDLTVNGIIVEPGAPALEAENPAPIANPSCGACAPGAAAMMPMMLLGLYALRRPRRR